MNGLFVKVPASPFSHGHRWNQRSPGALPGPHSCCPGDVTSYPDNQRAIERTVSAFGQLDVLVGNDGIRDGYVRLVDLPEDRVSAAFERPA